MAFTIQTARDLAQSRIDEDIEEKDAVRWAKEFILTKVDSEHWPETEDSDSYAEAEEDTWYNLPSDFVSAILVEDSDGDEYEDYEIRSRKIKFEDDGAYTLTYRSTPTAITAISTAVGMSDLFQVPMAKFLASCQRSKDDSEDVDALRWLSECDQDLSNIFAKLQTSEPLRVKGRW